MVQALGQITSIPDVHSLTSGTEGAAAHENIVMDEVIREAILSTFAFNDPSSPNFRDTDACDLREMVNRFSVDLCEMTVVLNLISRRLAYACAFTDTVQKNSKATITHLYKASETGNHSYPLKSPRSVPSFQWPPAHSH
jgi:hypothetical protein